MAREIPNDRVGECAHDVADRGGVRRLLGQVTWLVVLLMMNGCACIVRCEQTDLFRRKHPEEARAYVVLEPTSLAYMEYVIGDSYGELNSIIKGVEKRKDDPVALAQYIAYLKKCVLPVVGVDDELQRVKRELRKGDALCFFKYRQGVINGERGLYGDYGILILRGGDIIYRSAWGSRVTQNHGHTNEPAADMTFDGVGN